MRQRLDCRANLDNGRGADENSMKRRICPQRHMQFSLETIDLPAKVVAIDQHIQTAQQGLPPLFLPNSPFRQQNHPGAGAPDRLAGLHPRPQRLDQPPLSVPGAASGDAS